MITNRICIISTNFRVFILLFVMLKNKFFKILGYALLVIILFINIYRLFAVQKSSEARKEKEFEFNRIFGPSTKQASIYLEISELVQSLIDGYSVTIFAYGATGTRKSYTKEGGKDDESGIIPRSVQQIFRSTEHLKADGWQV